MKGSNVKTFIFCAIVMAAGIIQGAELPARSMPKIYTSNGETFWVLHSKYLEKGCLFPNFDCTDNIIAEGANDIEDGLTDIVDGVIDTADGVVDTVKGIGGIGVGLFVGTGRFIFNVGDETLDVLGQSHSKIQKSLHKVFCCEKHVHLK